MKKTGQIIYPPILLLVFFSRLLSDPGTSILQLDTENAKNYLSPMGTMLGAGMNTGYFQKASVYKKNGFDVTLDIAFVMFLTKLQPITIIIIFIYILTFE